VDADGEAEEGEVQHGREFGYAWNGDWSKDWGGGVRNAGRGEGGV
jgi:hypothetical protein